jgi:arsenate reductase-like glutaredoxin family protein
MQKKYFPLFLALAGYWVGMTPSCLCADQALKSNFSEDEYAHVERIYTNNTACIDQLVEFVDMNILSKKTFLDIGAGPGVIASRLSHFFTSATIVEPNKAYIPIYKDKGFISYFCNFQDVMLEDKYDFILCSHVLYHVPRAEWAAFLEKMYGLIRSGGTGLISMVAPVGQWHTLRLSINPDCTTSQQVEQMLKEQGIPYSLIPVQNIFNVPNYEDFRALIRLFTIENCYPPDTYKAVSDSEKALIDQRIEEYIATRKQPDGSYEFLDEDVYILLHKK